MSSVQTVIFWRKPLVPFWEMLIVRLMVQEIGWGRLHLTSEDDGSFGSWGYVILGYIDVWLLQLQCSSLTSWSSKFRNRTFLISWRNFLQGFVVLQYLGVLSEHIIAWEHKGREITPLVQAGFEIFLLLFALSWERRTAPGFRWMMDGASRFVIRTYVQTEISLMIFQIFLISRSPRSSVGVDIASIS